MSNNLKCSHKYGCQKVTDHRFLIGIFFLKNLKDLLKKIRNSSRVHSIACSKTSKDIILIYIMVQKVMEGKILCLNEEQK